MAWNIVIWLVYATLWACFAVALVFDPCSLRGTWRWLRGLPLLIQVAVWLLFLPFILGLWIWQLSWPAVLRGLSATGLCLGTLVLLYPWHM